MKQNLFKLFGGLMSMAIVLLVSQPMLAQSGSTAPSVSQSPKPVASKFPGKFIESDIKVDLKKLDLHLANLDHNLSRMEVRLAPKVALSEERTQLAIQNLAEDIEINIRPLAQPEVDANYIQGAEKTKTMTKSYKADANDKLSINNQYGNVVINTWPKNEIKVDIEIKSYESSESRAQEQLDGVSISESRQGDLISFKTDINKKISWWSRTKNGREERRGVQINYVVYMPAKNPLDITNRYGRTVLPDFAGPLNIVSSYGSFKAQNLENPANRVKVSYGSVDIQGYSSGMLNISYGSLKLASADQLNADVRYTSAKIGRLTSGGNLDISYGDCKLEVMDKSVKSLVINSSYSGLSIGVDEAAKFTFDVTVSYAGFKFDEDKFNITSKSPENAKGYNPTKNWKGTYGKGSDSRVIIKSNYGGVKFL